VAKGNSRRRSRELALQVLYQMEHGTGAGEALELFEANFSAPERLMAHVRELVVGIAEHGPELDEALGRASRSWRVERMGRVDRNILRLAAYEMLFVPEVPPRVAINEAVELAKRYAGEESPGFINAVLDSLRQQPAPPGD
jgi:N utilization substance protein B